jgi:hypothetical protein
LLEIGDAMRLEIVLDLLSTDAVRVQPGWRAIIEQWGGADALDAIVRRIEPSGFTKISALGVEEQRVNVILDFADPSGTCPALGDAFRVESGLSCGTVKTWSRCPPARCFATRNNGPRIGSTRVVRNAHSSKSVIGAVRKLKLRQACR